MLLFKIDNQNTSNLLLHRENKRVQLRKDNLFDEIMNKRAIYLNQKNINLCSSNQAVIPKEILSYYEKSVRTSNINI